MKPNYFKHVTANAVALKPFPFPSELGMEAYLEENATILRCRPNDEIEIIGHEVRISDGETRGRIDLVARFKNQDKIAIIELKKELIDENALQQLNSYIKNRQNLIDSINNQVYDAPELSDETKIIGILVGSEIDEVLKQKIQSGTTGCDVPVWGITIERYLNASNNEIITLSHVYNGQKVDREEKPKGRYLFEFNGNIYKMGMLVNQVLKTYVKENPTITYAELARLFPHKIAPPFGVFVRLADAEHRNDVDKVAKRYYTSENMIIHLADISIATSNNWIAAGPSRNIHKFLDAARNVGFNIRVVEE